MLGNVIGSNILNILLILGISALFHDLSIKETTLKKELPFTVLISTAFAVLLSDTLFDRKSNAFTRSDAIIILLFFLVFIYYLVSMASSKTTTEEEQYMSMKKATIFTLIGIVAIVIGSNMVVSSASALAKAMGVSEKMIALTVVAFGTSLPELVTSVTATRKGEYDIAIGNVVGSNIFNIGMVIGIPATILGGIKQINFNPIDLSAMLISAILLFVFSINKKISKIEGCTFLAIFLIYYSYVINMG